MKRALKISLILLILLSILYVSTWYVIHNMLISGLNNPDAQRRLAEKQLIMTLPDPVVEGFPGLSIKAPSFQLANMSGQRSSINAQNAHMNWSPFAPLTVTTQADNFQYIQQRGPFTLTVKGNGPVTAKAGFQFGASKPITTETAMTNLHITQTPQIAPDLDYIDVQQLNFKSDDSQLSSQTMVLQINGLSLPPKFAGWNANAGQMHLAWTPPMPAERTRDAVIAWGVQNGRIVIGNTNIAFANQVAIDVTGEIGWNGDGLMNGALNIKLTKPDVLMAQLSEAGVLPQRTTQLLKTSIAMLSQQDAETGQKFLKILLTIKDGRVKFGSITIPGPLLKVI